MITGRKVERYRRAKDAKIGALVDVAARYLGSCRIRHFLGHKRVAQIDIKIRVLAQDILESQPDLGRVCIIIKMRVGIDGEDKTLSVCLLRGKTSFVTRGKSGCAGRPVTNAVVIFGIRV